jgi:phosphatidylserine/phosphatidylglycerophosphate/cardiolipin synthase-like enzyme
MIIFQLLFFVFSLIRVPLWGSAITSHATVYFSPEDQLDKRLIEQIDKETKSIHVCIYTFTHRSIADALVEAKKRGVEVEVIIDRFSVKIKSIMQRLVDAGIPVFVWDPDRLRRKIAHRPLMHNKFCIFGSDKVWTGSFDFTYEASKVHQENALVLLDASLASAYKGQFHTIKIRSCIPLSSYAALHPKKRMITGAAHRRKK